LGVAVSWVTIVLNVGTDVLLCIIPFPALILITEKRIRIAMSMVFGLAGVVIIVSLTRAILIRQSPVKSGELIITLSTIEVATGIIISAIPEVSRSFTRKYLESTREPVSGDSTANNRRITRRTAGRTADGAIKPLSNSKLNKSGSVGLGDEIVRQGDEYADIGSRDTTEDGVGKQGACEFHNRLSTEAINPYPVEEGVQVGSKGAMQGKLKTAIFEMKLL
jgi:hypothetical protein